MEIPRSPPLPECVGGSGLRSRSAEKILIIEEERTGGCEEFEFPVNRKRRFSFESEERTGFGSRVALHGEPGGFGGVEEENGVTV